ncbi:S8 family serine peptidase [Dactylosporangium sp. CA-092794]|uniref:S8 family serine peptidase n=1 Tax=Dactylosporangium sp. CA-092794 TaxID=3239929 RepID=UPI003D8A1127
MTMSTTRRTRAGAGLSLALALGVGLVGLAASPVAAAPSDNSEFVKYYTVTSSYNGAPENLTEIATRFLEDGRRSAEVFNLNSGRQQPDGGALTDGNKLHAGWELVLPWDAIGAGVQYGLLPTTVPKPAATPPSPGKPGGGATGSAAPTKTAAPSISPSRAPGAGGSCTVASSSSSSQSDWATLRLAPEQALTHTSGKGELIAIVDSGADGSLPQLTGHVTIGADVVASSGRGDIDCIGSGTAMAGLIVGQPTQSSNLRGIAPDAVVMPIRMVTNSPKAQPADGATAIEVATSAGATVIALGSYVDCGDPEVAAAIAEAATHDVVVVCGAPVSSTPVDPSAGSPSEATIRVGGVSVDGQHAASYRLGAIDVVAPGVNITSLGTTGTGAINGTGTQYAVAYVAGEAALIRALYPDLTAAQVVHRIEVTADKMSDAVPDGRYGYGLINPGQSVTKSLPEEARSAQPAARPTYSAPSNGGRGTLLVFVALIGLGAGVLLVLRIRRLMRAGREDQDGDDPGPDPGPEPPDPADDYWSARLGHPLTRAGAGGAPRGDARPDETSDESFRD